MTVNVDAIDFREKKTITKPFYQNNSLSCAVTKAHNRTDKGRK